MPGMIASQDSSKSTQGKTLDVIVPTWAPSSVKYRTSKDDRAQRPLQVVVRPQVWMNVHFVGNVRNPPMSDHGAVWREELRPP